MQRQAGGDHAVRLLSITAFRKVCPGACNFDPMENVLLILDLDETLVLGLEEPLVRPPDFSCGAYSIYKRPGVHEFLDAIRNDFDIAVWSSATEAYVRCIVKEIFGNSYPLSFVWSRNRCTLRMEPGGSQIQCLKDLKKVRRKGYRLERVLMIDDDAACLSRNYGNLIRVGHFSGDPSDNELYMLLRYLKSLPKTEDVRLVDKRGWRHRLRHTDSG